jgi:hypothetical protein
MTGLIFFIFNLIKQLIKEYIKGFRVFHSKSRKHPFFYATPQYLDEMDRYTIEIECQNFINWKLQSYSILSQYIDINFQVVKKFFSSYFCMKINISAF